MTDLGVQMREEIDLLLRDEESAVDLWGRLSRTGWLVGLRAALPILAEYVVTHPDAAVRPALRDAHKQATTCLETYAALERWVAAVSAGGGAEALFDWVARQRYIDHIAGRSGVVDVVMRRAERELLPPLVLAPLRRMVAADWVRDPWDTDLLWEYDGDVADVPGPVLNPGEAWSDLVLADLDGMAASERELWDTLLAHVKGMVWASPKEPWSRDAQVMVDRIGPGRVVVVLRGWLDAVGRPRTVPLDGADDRLFDEWNARWLRGLVWLPTLLPADADLAETLTGVFEAAHRKVPGATQVPDTSTRARGRAHTKIAGMAKRVRAELTARP